MYGLSGVASRSMRLLDTLGIRPDDPVVGRDFCDALTSYIVGSKIHTVAEVHGVFNLHLALIHGREELKKLTGE